MPRPKQCRRICGYPDYWSFIPKGLENPDTIVFTLDDKYEERMKEAEHDAVADKDSVLGDLKEKKQEIAKKEPAKDAATKAATKKYEISL